MLINFLLLILKPNFIKFTKTFSVTRRVQKVQQKPAQEPQTRAFTRYTAHFLTLNGHTHTHIHTFGTVELSLKREKESQKQKKKLTE